MLEALALAITKGSCFATVHLGDQQVCIMNLIFVFHLISTRRLFIDIFYSLPTSTAVNKQANAPVKQTFTAGVVPETIGQNVPIAAKEKVRFLST